MGRSVRTTERADASPLLDEEAWDTPDGLTAAECAAELGDDRLRPESSIGEDER